MFHFSSAFHQHQIRTIHPKIPLQVNWPVIVFFRVLVSVAVNLKEKTLINR